MYLDRVSVADLDGLTSCSHLLEEERFSDHGPCCRRDQKLAEIVAIGLPFLPLLISVITWKK